MPLLITPEVGIPLPFDTKPEDIDDFREKAHAMFQTVEELANNGLKVEVTEADKAEARILFAASKPPTPKAATPGTIVHLESILNEWDQEVLDVGRRLRNYVTNKLISETVDPDPKVRLKSLELLGKVSNVGLFAERVDINVTHRTIHDIESDLKKTLELFTGQVIDVQAKEVPKSIAEINLDEELGTLSTESDPDTPEQVEGFDES
jgi:DNA topoisomerase VI subunit B